MGGLLSASVPPTTLVGGLFPPSWLAPPSARGGVHPPMAPLQMNTLIGSPPLVHASTAPKAPPSIVLFHSLARASQVQHYLHIPTKDIFVPPLAPALGAILGRIWRGSPDSLRPWFLIGAPGFLG